MTRLLAPGDQQQSRTQVRSAQTRKRSANASVWTLVDRDYETFRIGMQPLFRDLGITTAVAAA